MFEPPPPRKAHSFSPSPTPGTGEQPPNPAPQRPPPTVSYNYSCPINNFDTKWYQVTSTKPKSSRNRGVIPLEEDMRRLFQECKVGHGNATLLSEALAFAKPEDLKEKDIIQVRVAFYFVLGNRSISSKCLVGILRSMSRFSRTDFRSNSVGICGRRALEAGRWTGKDTSQGQPTLS